MTKTERNQIYWALLDARTTILALTDGKGRVKAEAKEDSPIVADRCQACLQILRTSEQ